MPLISLVLEKHLISKSSIPFIMKKLVRLLCLVAGLFFLPGCFDTTEEITIEKNGSGVYQINADMSGFFELIRALQAMDTTGQASLQKFPDNLDTLIHLRSFTDTATNLSAEEKALLQNATIRMTLSEKDNAFRINLKYPYKSVNDIQKIIKLNQSGNNPIEKALQGKQSLPADMGGQQLMPDFNSIFDMTYQNGLIEKKVNAAKLKELQEEETFAQMQQALEMMSDASMSTVIHLPKAAKKAEGQKVQLSKDKKNITIKTSLSDLLSNPQSFAYRIEY